MRRARTTGPVLCGLALIALCAGCGTPATLLLQPVAARTERAEPPRLIPVPPVGVRAPAGPVAARPGQAIDPAMFRPGACVSFAPVGAARDLTVFLDAGHGGIDPGAVGTTESGRVVHEASATLAVELDTMAILRGRGFRVVVSRTRDTTVLRLPRGDVAGRLLTVRGARAEVAARDVCANDAHANVLVGIYFDAGAASNAGSVTGYDAVRPFARDSRRLAGLLQSDVLAAMNARGWDIPDEGVQLDSNLGSSLTTRDLAYGHLLLLGPRAPGYFSTPSDMPGALIEPLFITDPFEGSIAASPGGQEVIARGVAMAIEQYFAPTA